VLGVDDDVTLLKIHPAIVRVQGAKPTISMVLDRECHHPYPLPRSCGLRGLSFTVVTQYPLQYLGKWSCPMIDK
jgi:hypothetical protein